MDAVKAGTPRTPVRVLVIEDSLTVRKRLVEVLSADPDLDVIGEAANGKEGVELCRSLRPNVVTLDMMMPVMNGLSATEQIMAFCPTPILVVSSSMNRGDVFNTFDALTAGAIDVLDKARIAANDETWERKLVSSVKMCSRIRVITHPRARIALSAARPAPIDDRPAPRQNPDAGPRLVAIGASTGGPGAVVDVLRGLGPDFHLPILLVLHIGEAFGASFAEWLHTVSPIPVALARDGEALPEPGQPRVVMAPPGTHLVIQGGRLRLNSDPERHSCRPSVDTLFDSVAREIGAGAIGCLLTGMGKDGAQGLLAMRRAGAATMAQDEATSVVFGMPREAFEIGAVDSTLSLSAMAPMIRELTSERRA